MITSKSKNKVICLESTMFRRTVGHSVEFEIIQLMEGVLGDYLSLLKQIFSGKVFANEICPRTKYFNRTHYFCQTFVKHHANTYFIM